MAAVEQGFSLAPREPMDISYLWGLKGKLLLEDVAPGSTAQLLPSAKSRLEEAEKCFRKAIAVAAEIGAKGYELRSATSLGRLLAASGRPIEARAVVKPLLKSIKEGLDTQDLIDAHQLMEELG
jgi:hypothetical protein